jgi:DNA-binding MarR family transcriptional regulator
VPVGALVRRPAVAVRRRIIAELHAAGFTDLQAGHLAVFAWPGPQGLRPGLLAVRADASKQAMNHLLGQLETEGYLRRESDPSDRRTRLVQLTERGHEAWAVLVRIIDEIESEWRAVLGERAYLDLQEALTVLNQHLESQPAASNHD